jgi:large subunit ribosomal protein L32
MPVPKRRKSQARTRMQRAANMRIDFESLPASCKSCGEPKPSHRICPACGKYGEKQIIPVVKK